ncbi:major facilitator superfamily transporter [Paucilactobacillus hokkaidonensis JCM 18461]|uniref:Major facilitator superfamily transporter n=2 Tax=Paucilactobacillus hokkaidonensis TaxID=1193095 RepID=A0A0A1GWS1_9LACO|nr:sugar porter family MFS transporter [Paucilactobacillus hokkaidonensis]KRO09355.1 D-xylose proton-symporter [Paucilactobacillus hokkaidonensis]BAP84861.1 major facilitator superfamily transporter [Paucilactobacillus hokkaidonensis JCM 18461]
MRTHHLSIFFIFVFGALGGLLFGFDTGIISGASPLIENDFNLSISQTGFITSSVLIGSSIGALSIGSLSDKFGRRKLLLVASILFLLGSGLSMCAVGFTSMIIARIILGFAVGSASALTPAYLAELADAPHRGSLGTMFQLMVTLGILLAYVSNLGFLHHNLLGIRDWRWMLGSALIPAAILFIGSLILPESPRFLVEKGKVAQAREILHGLRANTDEDPDKELESIQAVANQPKGGLKELFTIARPAVLVAIGLMLLQQLVGINSVIYFLPQVFIKGFGFAEGNAIWISVGIGIVNFVCTILAYNIMDKFNRRTILLFGSIVMAVSIGVLAILNFTLSVKSAAVPTMILIAVYIFGFAVSWGPICWLMIGEIFPLNVRGVGNSIGSAANWIGNFIVSQFFLVLLAKFHNNVGGPFAVFAFFAVVSIFFVIYAVPETRGKTLEEIEMTMRHKEDLKETKN